MQFIREILIIKAHLSLESEFDLRNQLNGISVDVEKLLRNVFVEIMQTFADFCISVYRYLIRALPRFDVYD